MRTSKAKPTTLVFLQPFDSRNPTSDQQLDFIMTETCTEVECKDLGKIYNNEALFGKDLDRFIRQEAKRYSPEWIIGEGKCATTVLNIRYPKRILINPTVRFKSLNNVYDHVRSQTYGFFDKAHDQDYERFQSVYPNAAFYPAANNHSLLDLHDVVLAIISNQLP